MSAFREAYEYSKLSSLWDLFLQLATDGRPLGIHLVVTGDRPNSVPASLLASIQRRLVLRLSAEDDYLTMDVPKDVLGQASPPGRGLLGGHEVQLAVLGGNSNLALQAREVHKLSEAMLRQGVERAPRIERLPEQIDLDILPAGLPDLPVIGVDDETLQPATLMAKGPLLLAGPPGAGRTVALVTMAYALRRSNPGTELVYLAARQSAVASLPVWDRSLVGADDVEEAVEALADHASANPGQAGHLHRRTHGVHGHPGRVRHRKARGGVHQGRPVGGRRIRNVHLVIGVVAGTALQVGPAGTPYQSGRYRRRQPAEYVTRTGGQRLHSGTRLHRGQGQGSQAPDRIAAGKPAVVNLARRAGL